MGTTLAQLGRPPGRRPTGAVAVAVLALAGACVGWGGSGVAVQDEIRELEPTEGGTWQLVGTERDSRTGAIRRVADTYVVQPSFERDGRDRQITEVRDLYGTSRSWETVFRPEGAFRLRETAGPSSWDWQPPIRSIAAPLRPGRVWTSESTATLPDLRGYRRVTSVVSRSEVVGTATVSIGGRRVFAFVIEAVVTTTVTDTNRVDRTDTTTVDRTTARTWFSPRHMRVVRSWSTSKVKSDAGDYELVRRVEAERL